MADDFTARFRVDISDLKQNIAEANKQIKLANATFKKEVAGMDKWSDSADGLSSRLKQLKTVLESQKKILESYKGQLAEQQKAYKENGERAEKLKAKLQELAAQGVEKTSDEYQKYRKALKNVTREQEGNGKAVDTLNLKILEQEASVKDTEKQIRHYNDSLDNLGTETEDVQKKVEKTSDGFTVWKGVLADLAATAIKAVVDGLKDMGAAAMDAWSEFDEGADNITKRTGATGEAAEALQEVYKNVAGNVAGSLGDIGDAVGEVNTRFGSQGKELEDLSTKFLKFAQLNDMDVAGSIDSVQAAMAAFHLDASEAGNVLDILNKAAQDTGVPLDKLSETLLTNGEALQEMGFDINTAAGFLGGLEKSGVDTSTVLTGLKKALANATKEGKPLDEALAELQENMEQAGTDTEAAQLAMELFGNKAGPAIAGAVQDGRLSFDQFSNTVQDFGGSVEETFDATLDAPDQLALAMQKAKVAVGETVGDFLDQKAPQLQGVLDDLTNNVLPLATDALGALLDGFVWLTDNGDKVVGVLGGIAAGVGAYIAYTTALKVMEGGWKALTVVTNAQAVAQKALNIAMNANPIGIVIGLIAALAAAFLYFWNTSEEFREFWINLWNGIKEAAGPVIEGIVDKFNTAWETIKGAWSSVGSFFSDKWKQIKKTFSGVKKWFSDIFGGAWTAIKNKFSGWVSFWSGLWNKIKSKFSSLGTNISNAISGSVKSGINKVISKIESTINSAISIINGAIGLINKLPGVSVDTVSRVSFPRLAKGGILKRGQVGILEGDGAEAVVPLEKNKEWIIRVAEEMLDAMRDAPDGTGGGGYGGGRPGGIGGTTNYTQIINAPKQPSRIELYRQTRNLLALR